MIFLLNTKITDVRLSGGAYRRYAGAHYPTSERMEIFKYYLASQAVLLPLISKCIFYIELGPELLHRKDELETYIRTLFPDDKLVLRWYRNNITKDWRNAYAEIESIDDGMLFIATNDDHIFIDNSLDVIKDGLELLAKDEDPMAFIYYSHWPEQIRLANQLNATLVEGGNFVKYNWSNFDAVMIMKKARFQRYWFEFDFGDYGLYKIDHLLVIREPIPSTTYTPTKEIVRHFDGYDHVGNFNNLIPPLTIPPGFFEKDMKILYGFPERNNEFVNINPSAQNLYAVSESGTDYRWCLNDIPLFWRDRITKYFENQNALPLNLRMWRDHYFLQSTKIPMNAYYMQFDDRFPPEYWFKKHLI